MRTALIILFIGATAIFSLMVKSELRVAKSPLEGLKLGEPMPDFTLQDTAGNKVTLSKVISTNKLVMINFWASWCGPCRVEMPAFEKILKEKGKDGFAILSISEDDDRAKLDSYLKSKPLNFPVLLDDDGSLGKRFGISSLPTTILVDGKGKIVDVHEGVQPYVGFTIEARLKAAPKIK